MLTMLGSPRRCCDGLTRRETLKAGALSALGGLSLPSALAAEEGAAIRRGKAKNVIVLYLLGGAPTQDMFDLKPNAPSEIRGEFQPIATSAPGVAICELLPKMAKWMRHVALVRSVHHAAGCHNTLPSYTGYDALLDNIVSTKPTYPPSMGSVCDYLGMGAPGVPAYVYMPCYLGWGQAIRRPGPYGGFLGNRYDPLYTECEPYIDHPPEKPYHAQPLRGAPRLPHSKLSQEMTIDRFNERRGLLRQIDDRVRDMESTNAVATFDRQQKRAFEMVTNSKAKSAFELDDVPAAVREKYGQTLFGQSALIARRLVEAGVRFVNVTWDCYWERLKLQFECWDTHQRNFGILRDYNLPVFDQVFDALMQDLHDRGLLSETLVVVMSDMGRTPKINPNAGRDHWTHAYSVALAGAGIQGGAIHGATDAQAAFVKDKPVRPADICATIYRLLGVDPDATVPDQLRRPVGISHGGRPIAEILA